MPRVSHHFRLKLAALLAILIAGGAAVTVARTVAEDLQITWPADNQIPAPEIRRLPPVNDAASESDDLLTPVSQEPRPFRLPTATAEKIEPVPAEALPPPRQPFVGEVPHSDPAATIAPYSPLDFGPDAYNIAPPEANSADATYPFRFPSRRRTAHHPIAQTSPPRALRR